MIKKILYLFLSLSFIFFIAPTSRGFENNKENIITNEDGSKAFIPYTQENIINGRIKGGHDTLTAEGVQLKKEVHKGDDDEGRKFNLWANEDALPSSAPVPMMRTPMRLSIISSLTLLLVLMGGGIIFIIFTIPILVPDLKGFLNLPLKEQRIMPRRSEANLDAKI